MHYVPILFISPCFISNPLAATPDLADFINNLASVIGFLGDMEKNKSGDGEKRKRSRSPAMRGRRSRSPGRSHGSRTEAERSRRPNDRMHSRDRVSPHRNIRVVKEGDRRDVTGSDVTDHWKRRSPVIRRRSRSPNRSRKTPDRLRSRDRKTPERRGESTHRRSGARDSHETRGSREHSRRRSPDRKVSSHGGSSRGQQGRSNKPADAVQQGEKGMQYLLNLLDKDNPYSKELIDLQRKQKSYDRAQEESRKRAARDDTDADTKRSRNIEASRSSGVRHGSRSRQVTNVNSIVIIANAITWQSIKENHYA